mmetsp:Transcript_18233/g.43611  ORF Transcript_18233/g.43611 Transcript_18233/m.43611 type:complete len:105 (-) Transcript_18233:1327-1641(-)
MSPVRGRCHAKHTSTQPHVYIMPTLWTDGTNRRNNPKPSAGVEPYHISILAGYVMIPMQASMPIDSAQEGLSPTRSEELIGGKSDAVSLQASRRAWVVAAPASP